MSIAERSATTPHPAPGASQPRGAPAIVACTGLTAGYGDLDAIREITLQVRRGEVVGLFGPNGAGKSTTMLALAGVLPVKSGTVIWHDSAAPRNQHRLARSGLAFIPEGRSVTTSLSVRDNLRLGPGSVDTAVDLFPELGRLLKRQAGLLSGGEQQMLVLARALAGRPAALLVDELSLGLAPLVVDQLLLALRSAADQLGLAVLLVEQQMHRALPVLDRWYLLHNGLLRASGHAATGADDLQQAYLAAIGGGPNALPAASA